MEFNKEIKSPFAKKVRYRIVALSDDHLCTYKLEVERSYAFDPDFWMSDLLSYSDDFVGLIRLLRSWLEVDKIVYDFTADEKDWIYFENKTDTHCD